MFINPCVPNSDFKFQLFAELQLMGHPHDTPCIINLWIFFMNRKYWILRGPSFGGMEKICQWPMKNHFSSNFWNASTALGISLIWTFNPDIILRHYVFLHPTQRGIIVPLLCRLRLVSQIQSADRKPSGGEILPNKSKSFLFN